MVSFFVLLSIFNLIFVLFDLPYFNGIAFINLFYLLFLYSVDWSQFDLFHRGQLNFILKDETVFKKYTREIIKKYDDKIEGDKKDVFMFEAKNKLYKWIRFATFSVCFSSIKMGLIVMEISK